MIDRNIRAILNDKALQAQARKNLSMKDLSKVQFSTRTISKTLTNLFTMFVAQDGKTEIRITFSTGGLVNFYQNGLCINPDAKPVRTERVASCENASQLYYKYIRMIRLTFTQR